MSFFKLRNLVLSFVFLSSCSSNFNLKKLDPFEFFDKSLSCNKVYKKLSQKKLIKYERIKLGQQADQCVQTGQIKTAFLIFEKLLEESEKQSASLREIKKWQKKLADLAFYKLQNYEKALKYYTSLLKKPLGPGEKFSIQYHIAESFFYLEKYSQTLRELKKCFFNGISKEQEKTASLLKGRVFMAQKKFNQALLFFEGQIKKFPEEENFFREYLALVYELKKDFVSAVEELKKIRPSSPFIEDKIQSLSERQNRQELNMK